MSRISYIIIILLGIILNSCGNSSKVSESTDADSVFHYAKHIAIEKHKGYALVKLADPWKQGHTLHPYVLINREDSAEMSGKQPKGTVVYIPLRHAVVFTAAHANLFEMLHASKSIIGVADAQYMHISDIQNRLKSKKDLFDVGNSMKPDIEKIINSGADAIFLSPFENSGGYGKLEEINIPIIECADYMETGALGRAEWMKFYGMLIGREQEADSLFKEVEINYNKLKETASKYKQTRSVLPDRKTGSVWYVPGGASSVGMMYKDAGGEYAFSSDTNTGSLSLPFETVLDKFGNADFWILSYNGTMTRNQLLSEYSGYSELKPFKTGEIYGCAVDTTPYFEEVSWRPDWLLSDLIQLFHPDATKTGLRYYHKLK